jgi:hypothetical protein
MWWLLGVMLAPVLSCLPCCDDCVRSACGVTMRLITHRHTHAQMENHSHWNHYGEAWSGCWLLMPLNVVVFSA